MPSPVEKNGPTEKPGLLPRILLIDEHIVAVDKPAGLAVHRSRLSGPGKHFALQQVRDLVGQQVYPVHRLDRPTSGVLLFARHPGAARKLIERFAERQVHKTYLAVVRGYTEPEGCIEKPLPRDAARENGETPPEAITGYRCMATVELPFAVSRYPTARYCCVAAFPLTGRMHQVRRHLKHLRHPIIGDTRYGDTRHNRFFAETLGCRRLLLAAVEITFPHPETGVRTTVTAPVDGRFAAVVDRFSWQAQLPSRWITRRA